MRLGASVPRSTRVLLVGLVVVCVGSLATAGVLFARDGGGSARSARATEREAPRHARSPSAARPLRLWVGGDSLAAGPSWAIFEAAHATGIIAPLAEYQVGTGLVRDEYWDWRRHLEAVVRARRPELVVFMVGANDDQPLAVDGTSYRPPAPEWVAEYRRRVAATMDELTGDGRKVIWIGMPPMRDVVYSDTMRVIDGIMADEAATRPAVTYVDAYALFSAPGAPGVYAQSIPDEFGTPTDVRLDDGIHLDVAGSEYLARRVMEEIRRLVPLPP